MLAGFAGSGLPDTVVSFDAIALAVNDALATLLALAGELFDWLGELAPADVDEVLLASRLSLCLRISVFISEVAINEIDWFNGSKKMYRSLAKPM